LCVLDDPVILVVDGELTTVRELLPIADYAKTSGRPLAVVAAAVTDDVLQTLEANALAGTLPAAAVAIPDSGQRRQFASLVGAVPITPADLKSGWVPTQHLGACATWVSSPTQLWVVADQTDADQA
jgi:chaperonin GroEL